jgi:Domain of unknown function (DUF4845)
MRLTKRLDMKQSMRRRQQGMTFLGLLCVLVLVGFVVYAGIRLVPVYLNYMNIARTLDAVAADFKGDNPSPEAIRTSLSRHWEVQAITVVDTKDIEITKDDSGISMHVAYDDSEPYIGNVSLAVHFDKTVKVQ